MTDAETRPRKQAVWMGLAAYLGTFLFIPLWDIFAWGYAVFTAWRKREATEDPAARAVALSALIEPVRRVLFLGLAYLLALVGIGPLLTLLASIGLGSQPGPFGFVATGANNYDTITGGPCCETSTVVFPGQEVTVLLARRMGPTLRLLGGVSLTSMLLVAAMIAVAIALHRVVKRQRMLGRIAHGALKLLATRALAAPAATATMVVVLFLILEFQLFPFGGVTSVRGEVAGTTWDYIRHLIVPSFMVAAMPSLLAAHAGYQAWKLWPEQYAAEEGRWAALGMAAGRAFYEQAGWIVGMLVVIEPLLGYPGLGSLMYQVILQQDAALLVGILRVFPLWLFIARLRAAITEGAENTYVAGFAPVTDAMMEVEVIEETESDAIEENPDAELIADLEPVGDTIFGISYQNVWLIIALIILAVPLVGLVQGVVRDLPDPMAIGSAQFDPLSDVHPLGTDFAGRDNEARLFRGREITLMVAVIGGLVALGLGGLWGGLTAFLKNPPDNLLGETVADIIRIPADAALILHPALMVLVFTVGRYSVPAGGQRLPLVGTVIGLALIPRMVWAFESLWRAAPLDQPLRKRLVGGLLIGLVGAMFAAYQYSIAVSFAGFGVLQPAPSLGNMLASFSDILAALGIVQDARFHVMVYAVASTAAVPAMGLYLLYDALVNVFGFKRNHFLPRMFS